MNFKIILIISVILVSSFLVACGDTTVTTNTNSTNTFVGKSNTNTDPLAVSTPVPEAVTNNAPTLTPVVKSYCAAKISKNDAMLRKIYSSDTIKHFEEKMKEEGEKSLVEYLSTDQVDNSLCEVVNERITGDTAIGKIKIKGYPNGFAIHFVKEAGEWKLTNRPAEDSILTTPKNSNTTK